MKKLLVLLLSVIAAFTAVISLSACDGLNSGGSTPDYEEAGGEHEEEKYDEHEHNFVEAAGSYLKSPATCTSVAVYYTICSICGIQGSDTFSWGGTLPHDFSTDIVREDNFKSPATCKSGDEYYCVCSVCGYVSDTLTFFSGESSDNHPFDKEWFYDDASHYHKVTCEHSAVVGRAAHDFGEDGKCKVCGAGKASVGLRYEWIEAGYYCVAGIGTCTDTDVVIMPEYNGEPVRAIEFEAFKNSNIVSVTIPKSIADIHYDAFYGCDALSDIYYEGDVNDWIKIGELRNLTIFGADNKNLYLNGELLTEADINGNVRGYAFYNCKTLKSVTLKNSVTYVGDYAFYGCEGITDIAVPDSVEILGQNVFENCFALKSVTLGGGITEIACNTFSNCKSLKSIVIPDGITAIEDYAFYACSALKSITVPLSIVDMSGAFYKCYALEEIYYGGGANDWVQIDGVMSLTYTITSGADEADKIELPSKKYYFGGKLLTEAVIDKATKINLGAFYGFETLESVTLGNGITEIPEFAFENCYNLNTVTILGNVTEIDKMAFNGCAIGNISYGGDINAWVQIGGLSNLTAQGVPNKNYNIGGKLLTEAVIDKATKINDYAFYGSSSLTGATIGNSVTAVGYGAFGGCDSLMNVTMGSGVTSVAESAFYNCAALESITVSNDNQNYQSRDGILYDIVNRKIVCVPPKVSGDITIPSYITEIGYAAFKYRKNITGVAMEGEEITIGIDAFFDCGALTELSLPEKVNNIGSLAFAGCYALNRINYAGDVNGWAQIDGLENLMGKSSLKKLYVDGELLTSVNLTGATKISPYAFYGCEFIMQVILCDMVEEIGFNAFNGCLRLAEVINYSKLNIEKGSDENGGVARHALSVKNNGGNVENCDDFWFISVDGVNYLLGYTGNATDIILPDSYYGHDYVIHDNAFLNFASLTKIVIPDGVSSIGNNAFAGCKSLTTVTLGKNVTSIGDSAFAHCANITSITIRDGVTSIGEYAFMGCNLLTAVNYDGTVEEWNNITKNDYWFSYARISEIICSDGTIEVGGE